MYHQWRESSDSQINPLGYQHGRISETQLTRIERVLTVYGCYLSAGGVRKTLLGIEMLQLKLALPNSEFQCKSPGTFASCQHSRLTRRIHKLSSAYCI